MKNLTTHQPDEVGIYILQNEDTQQTYFGSGILRRRFNTHRSQLKNGNHPNPKLQSAYNKNPNFVFIGLPIEGDDKKEVRATAFALEQMDISENIDNPLMLNIAKDVEANYRDLKHSPEAKAIMSSKLKEKWQDPQFREKTVAAQNEGKAAVSEDDKLAHRQKLSEAQHARYERIGESPTKGQTRSEEFCQRNSQYIAEKWQDPEYREKQRLAHQGVENVAARKQVSVDGVIYPSLTAAAQAFGITKQGALGRIKSEKNQTWKYLNT